MAEMASRELRKHTRAVPERVEAGASITITVDGRPVARLSRLTLGGGGFLGKSS